MQRSGAFGVPLAMADPARSAEEQREQLASWCKRWLRLARGATAKPACVFDIDDTLLHKDARIASICSLYEACLEMRIACFIITARDERHRAHTEEALAGIGIGGYRNLFMMRMDRGVERLTHAYVATSKLRWREAIARRGYQIVLNAGDAWTDHGMPHLTAALRDATPADAALVYITDDDVVHVKLAAR